MKKLLIILMVVAVASFLFVGCNGNDVVPDLYTLTMAVNPIGGGTTVPVIGTHPNHTAGTLVGISATPATGYEFVKWTGGVDAPNSASATVTMDADKTVTAIFEAEDEDVAVTGVTLDEATLALTVGDAAVTLVATVAPATATDTSVIWASSEETVAVVAAGVVTPLNAGISAITVTTVDGGFVATCVVTVTAESEPTPVSTTPVIAEISNIDLYSSDTQYINEDEADDGIFVEGFAPKYSEIKIYIDGEVVSTGYAYGSIDEFKVFITKTKLGEDGEKVLYATATEFGLVESADSTAYTFILDTVAPKIVEVAAELDNGGPTGTVTVTFDEALDEDTAEELYWVCCWVQVDHWTVDNVTTPATDIDKDSPKLTAPKVVELEVNFSGSNIGDILQVFCEDIEDLAGNEVDDFDYCWLLP